MDFSSHGCEPIMPIRLTQVSPLGHNLTIVPKIAARVEAPTYRDLYESEQEHPNPAKYRLPVLTG